MNVNTREEELIKELAPFIASMKKQFGDEWTDERTKQVLQAFDGMSTKTAKKRIKLLMTVPVFDIAEEQIAKNKQKKK